MPKSEQRLATDFFVAYFSSHACVDALLGKYGNEINAPFLLNEDPDITVQRILEAYRRETDFEEQIRKVAIVPRLIEAVLELGGKEDNIPAFIGRAQVRAMYRVYMQKLQFPEPEFAEDAYAPLTAQALFLSRMEERFRRETRLVLKNAYTKLSSIAMCDADLEMVLRARIPGIFANTTLCDRFGSILDAVLPQRMPFMDVHELYISGMSRTALRMAKGLLD